MIATDELREWLAHLDDNVEGIAIDEGGLALLGLRATETGLTEDFYLEVGGVPLPENLAAAEN